MESLLLELSGGGAAQPPAATSSAATGGEDAEARHMKEAWEKVFADALAETEGASPPPAAPAPSSKPRAGSTSGGKPEDFQKTIRETMERLKQSSADSSKVRSNSCPIHRSCRRCSFGSLVPSLLSFFRVEAHSSFLLRLVLLARKQPSATPDDPLAALLASLGDLGGDSGDGEGVLESMMDGLMSKEVLYDPLKELDSKVRSSFFLSPLNLVRESRLRVQADLLLSLSFAFSSTQYPTYLTSPEALALDPPQLHAYKLQADLVRSIVTLFDRPDFKDEDEGTKAEVRELMGKVRSVFSCSFPCRREI